MFTKVYWIIRKYFFTGIFHVKKLLFYISTYTDYTNRNVSFNKAVFQTILGHLLRGFIIISLLNLGDRLLLSVSNYHSPNMDNTLLATIIIGGMSIAGIILGLYCANIASIFSAKYLNAPQSMAENFRKDMVTNNCISQIIGYMVLSLLLLLECIIEIKLQWISIIFFFLMTIRVIITFSLTGNRTYILSDTFQIAYSNYISINNIFKKITNSKYLFNDDNFANHFRKICELNMASLTDVAKYNKTIPQNQNNAAVHFINNNLNLIKKYWEIKPSIYYDSYWYRSKASYKQWHYTSDTEITLALRTGTSLKANTERDIWWLENDFLQINNLYIEKFLDENDYESVQKYLFAIKSLTDISATTNTSTYLFEYLDKIKRTLIQHYYTIQDSHQKNSEENLSSLIDILCSLYIDGIAKIASTLKGFDLNTELKKAKSLKKYSDSNISNNLFLNNATCKQMYNHIDVEYKLEHRTITPDWFIEQTVAHQIYIYFGDIINNLIHIVDDLCELGIKLSTMKKHYAATIAFTHCFELEHKCNLTLSYLKYHLPLLQNKHFDPNFIWEELALNELEQAISNIVNKTANYFLTSSIEFTIQHWEDRESVPDFIGTCYNYFCEHLLHSIENDNIQEFELLYHNFSTLVFFYKEYVHSDLSKRKEPHLQNTIFYVISAPFIEYAMISGLAIVWGEFSENCNWKNIVEDSLKKYVYKNPEKYIAVLQLFVSTAHTRRRAILGIGNRDSLHIDWNKRIANAVMSNDKFQPIWHTHGEQTLKTNSKALSAFIGTFHSSHINIEDPEDLFFILCVNPYLTTSDIYKSRTGWEEQLDE